MHFKDQFQYAMFIRGEHVMGGLNRKAIRQAILCATLGAASTQFLSVDAVQGADTSPQVLKFSDLPTVKEDAFSSGNTKSEVQPASFNTGVVNACAPAMDACTIPCTPTVCCTPWWAHRTGIFGEILYLSAGNSDLIYALEQTGPNPGASPTGPLGITNIGEHVGFRVGGAIAQSDCSSLTASYARWDGQTTSVLNATGNNIIASTVIHPSVDTTGSQSQQAVAIQSASFQFADVALRRVYKASNAGVLNWNAGLRYGNMEQGLTATQTISVATGLTNVTTDIDFNGLGILGGLDGMRYSTDTGLYVYGRAFGSLLAGDWAADYTHINQFGGGVIANSYRDFRVSPVVDTEIGLGWQSSGGKLRLSTGYLFSTWFNAVTTRDYIQSVRTANLLNMDDNLTFSGLTARVDLRF
jgi:hypothetical protein